MRYLIVNAIITPDGTRLQSLHRHHYATHKDRNGETYMVDGGTVYLRRSLNEEPATDASVYSDDPHEKIREGFMWGSRGKTGMAGELVWILLKDLYSEHINAILDTQTGLAGHIREIFKNELTYRKENGIT